MTAQTITPPTAARRCATAENVATRAEELVPPDILSGGEVVLFAIKPSLWSIVLESAKWLVGVLVVIVLAPYLAERFAFLSLRVLVQGALAVGGLRLGFALLQWVSRLYVLTDRRVMRIRGIVNINLFECPLAKIQNTYATFSLGERLFGLGTIGFATAGTVGIGAYWRMVSKPLEVHGKVRRAIEKALDHQLPSL